MGEGGPEDREIERLRWRCRRGMLELDLLLGRFLETRYAKLDTAQREWFSRLLAAPDVELAAWIAGTSEPPDRDMREILKIVL
jgi:antitoxin CptB